MKSFKYIKDFYINLCIVNNSCKDEFYRVTLSKTKKQLLKVVKDNIVWCRGNNAVSVEILDWFGLKICNDLGIYYKGIEEKISNKQNLLFLENFKCKMLDNSQVGKMLDSSQVGEMWGSSTARLPNNNHQSKKENIKSINDSSQVIDLRNNKIYVKKSKFELIQI